jgi:hypothetical protein
MNDSRQLAAAIARKAQLLDLLRRLGEAQLSLVGAGDMTRLMQVLSSKDSLLQQLQNVERELDPFRDEDPNMRKWDSPDLRQACREDAARCAALLDQIVALEKQSEAEMIVRRDATAAQLQNMYGTQEAQGAYVAAPVGHQGSFGSSLDLSMEG